MRAVLDCLGYASCEAHQLVLDAGWLSVVLYSKLLQQQLVWEGFCLLNSTVNLGLYMYFKRVQASFYIAHVRNVLSGSTSTVLRNGTR